MVDCRPVPSGTLAGLFDLTGRVAIVTGGSRGLGLQIASALGEFGASLAIVARKQTELDAAVERLNVALHAQAGKPVADGCDVQRMAADVDDAGDVQHTAAGIAGADDVQRTAVGFVADLGDPEAIADLIDRVLRRFGRIDILVNNAGTVWGAPAEDYPLDGWNKVIDLNVTGLFLLTQTAARKAFLKQGKGSVINVASIEGLQGHHPDRLGTIAYNTAKGAVVNMTRALAAEWGPRNIRVNALAPGFFPSKLAAAALAEHGDEILRQTPLGKLGSDTDLMGAALLLASDAGGHITGQTLVIDGGATII